MFKREWGFSGTTNIDPSGRWLIAANQDSNNLVVFRLDADTGEFLGEAKTPVSCGTPVCIAFAAE